MNTNCLQGASPVVWLAITPTAPRLSTGIYALQSADVACEHAAGRMHDLEMEIRELRARHAEQIKQMQHQQTR